MLLYCNPVPEFIDNKQNIGWNGNNEDKYNEIQYGTVNGFPEWRQYGDGDLLYLITPYSVTVGWFNLETIVPFRNVCIDCHTVVFYIVPVVKAFQTVGVLYLIGEFHVQRLIIDAKWVLLVAEGYAGRPVGGFLFFSVYVDICNDKVGCMRVSLHSFGFHW